MNYAWIDLETTGTDVTVDQIIEVGLVVTDEELRVLYEDSWVVNDIQWPPTLSSVVVKMHVANDLLGEVVFASGRDRVGIGAVDLAVATTLNDWTKNGKIVLAGSGVGHFDRKFIDAHMPETAKRLTYWCLDIGVVRRFAMRVLGEKPQDHPPKTHRALDDAQLHVEEARYWREQLGVTE
ncbi:MAG TPA: exonuclease domain-containing protein [Acidimicrobiia bacterium]